MIISFFLHVIANALAVLVAAQFIPGVVYSYEPLTLIKIALILALIKLKVRSCKPLPV